MWWEQHGRERYPTATKLLLLCDGGGSNASNRHVFEAALQRLADRLGIEIRVAHYPPYCSKYNPIEHRVFPHVTRACQGVVFESVELVSDLISRTHTQTGLTVTTSILDRVFETGRKVASDFLENCRILKDNLLPKWNYRALPTPTSSTSGSYCGPVPYRMLTAKSLDERLVNVSNPQKDFRFSATHVDSCG